MIVYTVLTGNCKDILRPPVAYADPRGRPIQFVCLSDRTRDVSPYELRLVDTPLDNALLRSRWCKINSHLVFPDADYSVFHDGNQQLVRNPWEIVDSYLDNQSARDQQDICYNYLGWGPLDTSIVDCGRQIDLATYRHPVRYCVYQECKAVVAHGRERPEVAAAIVARYREQGIPLPSFGMAETSVVVRRHSEAMRRFNEAWWQQLQANGSHRDQLAFPVVAYRQSLTFACLPGRQVGSAWFKHYDHGT